MASAAPTTAWSPPAPRGTTTWRTVWRRSGAAARTYLQGGPRKLSRFFVPMMIPDIAAGVISIRHGFRGPNHCVVSACATGNHNLANGMEAIRRGGPDVPAGRPAQALALLRADDDPGHRGRRHLHPPWLPRPQPLRGLRLRHGEPQPGGRDGGDPARRRGRGGLWRERGGGVRAGAGRLRGDAGHEHAQRLARD